jgi:hypothetical protein
MCLCGREALDVEYSQGPIEKWHGAISEIVSSLRGVKR